MARKKPAPSAKTARTATARKTAAAGTARARLAPGPLQVEAQGATLKDDDRLIIAVRVRDSQGEPVTGLTKAAFKLWQLGHHFGSVSDVFVVELAEIAGLEGLYHLVRKNWSIVPNGTLPFYVRVSRRGLEPGGALTFIVKVREGLDT